MNHTFQTLEFLNVYRKWAEKNHKFVFIAGTKKNILIPQDVDVDMEWVDEVTESYTEMGISEKDALVRIELKYQM